MTSYLKITAAAVCLLGAGLGGCASPGPTVYATETGDMAMSCDDLQSEKVQLEQNIVEGKQSQDARIMASGLNNGLQSFQQVDSPVGNLVGSLFDAVNRVQGNREAENLSAQQSRRDLLVSIYNTKCY